jgi:hypothetical protein
VEAAGRFLGVHSAHARANPMPKTDASRSLAIDMRGCWQTAVMAAHKPTRLEGIQDFIIPKIRATVFALSVVISRVRAHRFAVEWSSAPLRYTTSLVLVVGSHEDFVEE